MRFPVKRVLRVLWILGGLSFTAWLAFGFRALSEARDAVFSDDKVTVVETDHGLQFQPRANVREAGLIFLPGGVVEPVAYAPLLRRLAELGYPGYLLNLPMRCACTDSQINELFQRVQQVVGGGGRRWVLAGHSRGGMLATRFVHEKRAELAGLALIGTTHPRDYSLAEADLPIAKIYGSRDGVASYAQMRSNQHLLPPSTTWIGIEGGNHVQFGYYRHQLGDDDATISRRQQQELLEAALLKVLSSVTQQRASAVLE